ncbi:glucoside xylosyltransferase 1-like [Haliotis rufescens]|uniref:glucoside xylosyltransferase 1-like n=1 Tax=Haliotis rufescens TaxID=6454 RepID=UPI00201EEC5B|nr:glucoside xylosyltransferase 1-like [Haliotis rufescens]
MRRRMIFKLGVTVVIAVAVIIVYIQHTDPDLQHQGEDEVKDKLVVERKQDDGVKKESIDGADKEHMTSYKKSEPLKKSENIPKSDKHHGIEKSNGNQSHSDDSVVNKKINGKTKGLKAVYSSSQSAPKDSIHLSVVACGDRTPESLILLKSAVLFTSKHLVFHIFAETQLQKDFRDQLDFWPADFLSKVDYFIYDISFPSGGKTDHWKQLFKPCASQRLFLPTLLTDVDALIYVDTDILFLSPLEGIWSFFQLFNSTQLAALAPEHEDAAAGWYNRFARHPYYGELGLNSGVMLMNLTRLRESVWLPSLIEYYKEYKLKIAWGDQDLINIYFHYFPEQLYVFGCDWNYRADHCMYMSVCREAETNGAYILHGSRRVFLNDKQPAFKAVYDAFKEHRLGDDIQYKLLVQMERNLEGTIKSSCGQHGHIYTKQVQIYSNHMREAEKKAREKMKDKKPPHPPR